MQKLSNDFSELPSLPALSVDDLETPSALLTRDLMYDRINHAIQRAIRNGCKLTLCCIEVDQLLTLQNVYGDEGVHDLLQQVGRRLQKILRAVDSLGQINDRTLTLLLEGISEWRDVEKVIQKIISCFAEPVLIDEQPHQITTSIGITEFDSANHVEATELFEQAEFACYRAQRTEGNGYAFFSGHLHARHAVHKLLANSIVNAYKNHEFIIFFQPIMYKHSCYALEALIRWQHPTAGNVLPSLFLQLLEENLLSKEIGDWMMIQACSEWQKLIHTGKLEKDTKLSLNIHQDQFNHVDFIKTLQQLLSRFAIDATQLILEFKGKTLMQAAVDARQLIEQIQALGFLVCVDNFGESDASLMCLQRFPLNQIKLAHGLAEKIETQPRDLLLIAHTLQLCEQLNVHMTIQSVDTQDKIRLLTEIGCYHLQGNILCPAKPAGEIKLLTATETLRTQIRN